MTNTASTTEEGLAGARASEGGGFTFFSTAIVAAAVGVTSMSFNVWWPFLPLFVLKLGATSDANALFWVALATTGQGLARLASGPAWGLLSDRVGRKMMFLRALYLSTSVGMVAAIATAPWQLIISLTLAGLFSGFNPAAVALVSVSVPESRLNRSLSLITGAQYIGTTAGPAVGAILALLVGYRGAIFVSSLVPLATGTLVLFFVPADRVDRRSRQEREADAGGPIESFRMTFQLFLGIFLYFLLFALNQLTRFITPIALAAIEGSDNVEGDAGVAFSLAGLVSAISVLGLAPFFFRVGRLKPALTVSCLFGAAGLALMAASDGTTVYIGGFLVLAAVLSAMTPAINTLIAANAARARRGTAFGIAGSAQALASVIGPSTAAVFAAVSLDLGFGILGGVLVAVSGLLLLTLREPKLE